MNDGLDVIGGGGPYASDEDRWLATLRARRAAGAYAVATLEDVERLIGERDEARAEVMRLERVMHPLMVGTVHDDGTFTVEPAKESP